MKSMSFVLFLLVSCQLAGQTDRGLISGTITDASGAAIPGAAVLVKSEKTGDERRVTADDGGRYVVTNLAPAAYAVEAKAPGLGPTQFANIQLTVGQERIVNIILQPAAIAQEVNVSS